MTFLLISSLVSDVRTKRVGMVVVVVRKQIPLALSALPSATASSRNEEHRGRPDTGNHTNEYDNMITPTPSIFRRSRRGVHDNYVVRKIKVQIPMALERH
jgi:hypothetical protein